MCVWSIHCVCMDYALCVYGLCTVYTQHVNSENTHQICVSTFKLLSTQCAHIHNVYAYVSSPFSVIALIQAWKRLRVIVPVVVFVGVCNICRQVCMHTCTHRCTHHWRKEVIFFARLHYLKDVHTYICVHYIHICLYVLI